MILSPSRAARWVRARSEFPKKARFGVAALAVVVASCGVVVVLPLYVVLCAAFLVWVVLLRPAFLEWRAQCVVQLVERRWESADPVVAVWVAGVLVRTMAKGRLVTPAPSRLWALSGFADRSPLLGPWLHDVLIGVLADVHMGFPYVRSKWYNDALVAAVEELASSDLAAPAVEVASVLPAPPLFVGAPQPASPSAYPSPEMVRVGRRAEVLASAADIATGFAADREVARLCVGLAPSWTGSPSELLEAVRALLYPALATAPDASPGSAPDLLRVSTPVPPAIKP